MSETPEEKAITRVARALDPKAWDTRDRFSRWELRFGHTMPSDGMDRIVSESRTLAHKAIDAYLSEDRNGDRIRKIANYLCEDDHSQTLDHHVATCVREDCDLEESYMDQARQVFLIAHGG